MIKERGRNGVVISTTRTFVWAQGNEENKTSPSSDPRVLLQKGKLPVCVLLTLFTSAPRRVICVCLQPWPPFLPHSAAPWAPCFLTNTWSAPECSPVTLCLNDRHRSPECMRWPRGSTKRAALSPGPLAAETARYCPPAMGRAGSWVYVQTSLEAQKYGQKLHFLFV